MLSTLVLTGNAMAELGDLDVLRGFARLVHLSLLENPVAQKEVSSRPVCGGGWYSGGDVLTGAELPQLGHLPRAVDPLSRFPEGQELRARAGKGDFRHARGAHAGCAKHSGIAIEQGVQLLGTDDEWHGKGLESKAVGQGEDEG